MWMLFHEQPRHIVQLGLGSAALTKFCYHRLPQARVTAIELNPNVIGICGAQFALPPNDARLDVREMNALDFVMDPANHNSADILQVDLYDEEARGPVLDTPEFYQACADCLTADGGRHHDHQCIRRLSELRQEFAGDGTGVRRGGVGARNP
ncbi:putative uncharacterized protein [Janthinobacterium agaricidamnosum NBRC 102515 = DSM 9628]|uniref:Spermidine synthase n=1 Tax=Janthinobacterium agaricidamnosum NBRC 102515 = DSM 9628 TaxID=1349767 RepID=W0VE35_9BURK|nr:putative uncharacterized protein [Janthinobacterium agaricidamnosum NBRC 102515 = DSM 9628]